MSPDPHTRAWLEQLRIQTPCELWPGVVVVDAERWKRSVWRRLHGGRAEKRAAEREIRAIREQSQQLSEE